VVFHFNITLPPILHKKFKFTT